MRQQSRASRVTTDHDEIREWAEARGGQPAVVRRTRGRRGPSNVGLLRIDFPRYRTRKTLDQISWDEFFEQFDQSGLAFVYQEEKTGRPSRFNKLVDRDSAPTAPKRPRVRQRRQARSVRARSPHAKAASRAKPARVRTATRSKATRRKPKKTGLR